MKAMVVYDSVHGNTERVAQAIGRALGSAEQVETRRLADVEPELLMALDVLVAGSPTHAFQPTPATKEFLKSIPAGGLEGVSVAAFDTRLSVDSPVLGILVKVFGYAAKPIANRLRNKGGELVAPPEGFIVEGTEGPLREGELERAADWARRVAAVG
ncbi:MAG: flavodoxin family protein [Anaerolineae bacterium]|jgi:flavodoxin